MEGRAAALYHDVKSTAYLVGRGLQTIRQLNWRLNRMLARVRIMEVGLDRHDEQICRILDRVDRLERLESRLRQSVR